MLPRRTNEYGFRPRHKEERPEFKSPMRHEALLSKPTNEDMNRSITDVLSLIPPLESGRVSLSNLIYKPGMKTLSSAIATLLSIFDEEIQPSQFDAETILDIFKLFEYPFPVNKNIFLPVGAPHTWSTCLTMVEWLSQIVRYFILESYDRLRNDLEDNEYEHYPYIEHMIYDLFNEDDNEEPGNASRILMAIKQRTIYDSNQIELLKYVNKSLYQERLSIESSQPDLKKVKDEVSRLERYLETKRLEFSTAYNEMTEAETILKDMNQQIEKTTRTIKQIEVENYKLTETIKASGITPDYVDRQLQYIENLSRLEQYLRTKLNNTREYYNQYCRLIHDEYAEVQKELMELGDLLHNDQIVRSHGIYSSFSLQPPRHLLSELQEYTKDITSWYTKFQEDLTKMVSIGEMSDNVCNNMANEMSQQSKTIKRRRYALYSQERQLKSQWYHLVKEDEIVKRQLYEYELKVREVENRHKEERAKCDEAEKMLRESEIERERMSKEIEKLFGYLDYGLIFQNYFEKYCDKKYQEMLTEALKYREEYSKLLKKQRAAFAQLHLTVEKYRHKKPTY